MIFSLLLVITGCGSEPHLERVLHNKKHQGSGKVAIDPNDALAYHKHTSSHKSYGTLLQHICGLTLDFTLMYGGSM